MFTATGLQPTPEPRELSVDEIAETVDQFRRTAAVAIGAGADGVEIHGATGYLLHQFLSSNANQRTDQYGGSIDNRIRFAVEVATAVAEEIGAGRTGFRISPSNPFNDITEHDVPQLYGALVKALAPLGLAYLHVAHGGNEALLKQIRSDWPGALVLNRGGADIGTCVRDIEEGLADVVTVGTAALANPDLVHRLQVYAPLNEAARTTFYGGTERGYID